LVYHSVFCNNKYKERERGEKNYNMPWEPKKGGDQRSSKERKHRKSITTNTKDVSNYNRSRKDP